MLEIALLGVAFVVGAPERPVAPAKSPIVARLAAVERDLCLASCPAVPADASSDWFRSEEGQSANGCRMACRTDQPASGMFRELCDLAGRAALTVDAPLVKLAGKDGLDLSKRLQLAVKDADGRRLGPLCARAREGFGPRDERTYLECVGRTIRPGTSSPAPPEAARALRCATALAERDLDWLKRCVALEARAGVDACVSHAEELAAARRQVASNARVTCESEAIERLAAAFRGPP